MINKKEITALLITSAIKTIPEIRKNMHSISRVAKDLNFIGETIENIKKFSGINKFSIVHDFKVDSEISKMHSKNLFELKNKYKFDLFISPSSLAMPSQLTASNAFKLGISKIKSKYLLFWEHDHLFINKIDWDLISKSFDYGGKLIKFNRKKNNINSNKIIQKDLILKEGIINQYTESKHKDLLTTNYYCNGPFIAETDFCEKLWKNVNFEIPNWNGIFGGFIEGPVIQKMIEEQLNLNEDSFRKKYPLFVYGGESFNPIVIHRGSYIPKYKFSLFSFDTYKNIPRIFKHKLFNIFKIEKIK